MADHILYSWHGTSICEGPAGPASVTTQQFDPLVAFPPRVAGEPLVIRFLGQSLSGGNSGKPMGKRKMRRLYGRAKGRR